MDSRIRKTAILVASVDSATAQQLLLQMSSDIASRIRSQVAQLGPVSIEERLEIIEEFRQHTGQPNIVAQASVKESAPPQSHNTWEHLTVEAILRVVRHERAPIVAVVVSQLPAEKAAEILSLLERKLGCQVVSSLSTLNLDPETRVEIEHYLSNRLSESQLQVDSEAKRAEKVQALMDLAPSQLQQEWLDSAKPQPTQQSSTLDQLPEPAPTPLPPPAVATSAEVSQLRDAAQKTHDHQMIEMDHQDILPKLYDVDGYLSNIPETEELRTTAGDASSSPQNPFEDLLDLPRTDLARLIAESDTETVLLALAGASPEFMRRLEQMIEPEDFAELQRRIRLLGTMRIRDIDEAQAILVQQATLEYGHLYRHAS